MGMIYRCDVLAKLKAKGYNAGVLRREKILSESTIQNLRKGRPISFDSLHTICFILHCQPNDIILFTWGKEYQQFLDEQEKLEKREKTESR